MSVINRPTWKQNFSDFINRINPFVDPLIPSPELQQVVGDDFGDSTLFSTPTEADIITPASSFSADFTLVDQYNIDTTASGDTSFIITLLNLNPNRTGLLSITKKSGDTFTFQNGVIVPVNSTEHQEGVTDLPYIVKFADGNYQLFTGVESVEPIAVDYAILSTGPWDMINTDSITVAHGISSGISRITGVNAVIQSDDTPSSATPFACNFETGGNIFLTDPVLAGKITWDDTNITLLRNNLGAFAGFTTSFPDPLYGSASGNRGNILVEYTP